MKLITIIIAYTAVIIVQVYNVTIFFPCHGEVVIVITVVPCFPECNSILGNKAIHSVIERAAYLVDGIAKCNKIILNARSFTEE